MKHSKLYFVLQSFDLFGVSQTPSWCVFFVVWPPIEAGVLTRLCIISSAGLHNRIQGSCQIYFLICDTLHALLIDVFSSVKLANMIHFLKGSLEPPPTLPKSRPERGWGRWRQRAAELQAGVVSRERAAFNWKIHFSAPVSARTGPTSCCSSAEAALWRPSQSGEQRDFV